MIHQKLITFNAKSSEDADRVIVALRKIADAVNKANLPISQLESLGDKAIANPSNLKTKLPLALKFL